MDAIPISRRIAAAGLRLLHQHGCEGVTMRRVARAVGITPMAIYRHYPDRAALLNALADEGFRDLAGLLGKARRSGTVEKRLTRMGEIFLDHALQHPRLFELMFLRPRAGARRYPHDFERGDSPTANLMANVVREGMETGYLRQDNVWEIVFEIGALSHGLVMLFLGGRLAIDAARFRKLYRRSFQRYINGIRK